MIFVASKNNVKIVLASAMLAWMRACFCCRVGIGFTAWDFVLPDCFLTYFTLNMHRKILRVKYIIYIDQNAHHLWAPFASPIFPYRANLAPMLPARSQPAKLITPLVIADHNRLPQLCFSHALSISKIKTVQR